MFCSNPATPLGYKIDRAPFHLCHNLPLGLAPAGFTSDAYFAILSIAIIWMRPTYLLVLQFIFAQFQIFDVKVKVKLHKQFVYFLFS